MDRATRARIARRAAIVAAILLAVGYAGMSYFIASGVTGAEREEPEDHPRDYGLEYEDVEFLSRKGDVTLEGWYLPSPCCGPQPDPRSRHQRESRQPPGYGDGGSPR